MGDVFYGKEPSTVAEFGIVSYQQFKSCFENESEEFIKASYDSIRLPVRKTQFSAGHDICSPYDILLAPGEKTIIPTGLRCFMTSNYVMLIFPRSSFGIKRGMTITNTIPVIDADYYFSDNEGHILISIKNNGEKTLSIKSGEAFAQAVFVEFGSALGSESDAQRKGGIGSTDTP